jgi:hypothetical protein
MTCQVATSALLASVRQHGDTLEWHNSVSGATNLLLCELSRAVVTYVMGTNYWPVQGTKSKGVNILNRLSLVTLGSKHCVSDIPLK